jgi:hypothetical protein
MATTNGQSTANGGISIAERLAQRHDEGHQPAVEEVVDESDLQHPEQPKSSSILESKDDAPVPTWAPTPSSKAAGKQKAQDSGATEPAKKSLDTQSHELFPELGGAPKGQAAPAVAPAWAAKKAAVASPSPVNGKTNGLPPSAAPSRDSAPASGTATPTAKITPVTLRATPGLATPGRHQEHIDMAPTHLLPRKELKKPIPDVVKEINKKSKANVTMHTIEGGTLRFNASGPVDATRQALNDIAKQIGSKVSENYPVILYHY